MTSLLAGQLQHVLLIGVIDGALLSWVALLWYRASVRRLMAATGGLSEPGAPGNAPSHASAPDSLEQEVRPLRFTLFDAEHRSVGAESTAPAVDERPRRARRRLLLAYAAGAAVWSALRVITDLAPVTDPLPAVAWLAFWWIHTWLIVPSLMLMLGLGLRATIRAAFAYLALGAAAIALFTLAGQVVRGSFNTAPITNVYYAFDGLWKVASLPAVFLLVTGLRRVRAVMPLAVAGVAVFGVTALLLRETLTIAFNTPAWRSLILGVSGASTPGLAYYGPFMIAALPAGWLAWRLLRWLASAFERKRFSDVQLIVDCWWAVLTIEESAVLSVRYGAWAIPFGLGMFVVYRTTVAVALRLWPYADPSRQDPSVETGQLRLTLLRVFGYQRRTESLFDRVGRRWRFVGPVQLIAGADLAQRTSDPGDVLAFLQGQLAERYVRHPDEIPSRMTSIDTAPDRDGLFRVSELYCHADTWRPTLQALLDVSDRVLADLRGFREHNAGCRFELEQVLGRVAAPHVVIVYDRTTDIELLGRILEAAWRALPHETGSVSGPVLVRVERQHEAAVRLLVRCLAGSAGPGRQVDVADLTPGARPSGVLSPVA